MGENVLKKIRLDDKDFYYPISELEQICDLVAKELKIGLSGQPWLNEHSPEPAWYYEKSGKKKLSSGRDVLLAYSSSLVGQYLKETEYDPGTSPFRFFERMRFNVVDDKRYVESAVIDRLADNPEYNYLYVFDDTDKFKEKYWGITEDSCFLHYIHLILDGSLEKEQFVRSAGGVRVSTDVSKKKVHVKGNFLDLARAMVKYDSSD